MSTPDSKKNKTMGDDPPYLAVGTDVSAKYKGAFCEAKVRKVVRVVKCKVAIKHGGSLFLTDDQIKGSLRIGSQVEVKLPDKKEFVEATISTIKDLSQYTVVFDDGDITTLRRTALCLKSGRHFAESETLDQLPLTHPEHFSTPVIGGGRRGRRRLGGNDDSSDDEEDSTKEKQKEADIGKVVCVEISDKKKQKDNWFPGLIVAPNAQDAVRIDVDEDYLVRSFKDGRYFTVPKKEAKEFTREIGLKVDNPTLKLAVEKALLFLDKDELPPHWDRDLLFGLVDSDIEDDSDQLDSDSSDDEPREEKDHFVAQLYKFMDDRGTPINKAPVISSKDVDLYRLFRVVFKLGGYNRVTNHNQWKIVTHKLGFGQTMSTVNLVKLAYKKFLHGFEDFYRKLGCTMVNHPRGSSGRRNNKSNRSLIRDKDRLTPISKDSDKIRQTDSNTNSSDEIDVKKEDEKDKGKEEKDKKEYKKVFKKIEESFSKKDKIRSEVKKVSRPEDKKSLKEEVVGPKRKVEDSPKVRDVIKSKPLSDDNPPKIKDTKLAKIEEKPKSSGIGILAKFTYKDKEKDKLNKVKKSSLGMKNVSNIMERQKRVIKEGVKAFVKTLGIGKSNSAATSTSSNVATSTTQHAVTSTRKMSVSEDEDKKRKSLGQEETEKRRSSSSSKAVTTPTSSGSASTTPSQIKLRKTSMSTDSGKTSKKSSDEDGASLDSNKKSNRMSRNRKKDDDDVSSQSEASENTTLDIVSPSTTISVGDKLKVYYGPNHKSKVTYEAKVLNTREEDGRETEFFVHYTGWNTRYDEWIKRNRIAENLSWTPSRSSKRISVNKATCSTSTDVCSSNVQTQTVEHSAATTSTSAQSTPPGSKSRSMVKRPSSRNLSKHSNRPTRSSRTNTDDSESDKESDSESEADVEPNNRSMRSRRIRSDILSDEDKNMNVLSKRVKKSRTGEEGDDEDEEDDKAKVEKTKEDPVDKTDMLPSQESERKSLRLSQRKNKEAEIEKRLGPESDSESEEGDMKAKVLELIEPKDESLDDVYEFKEPEPFDFKQKKTISPPRSKKSGGKLNIGLFEDYDNTDEDTDSPISAAIQRVIGEEADSSLEMDIDMGMKKMLSSDSEDSSSTSSSDTSTYEQESFSILQDKKRPQATEWKTYEGPKSELKKERALELSSPRTRRSSETSSEYGKSKKVDLSSEKLKADKPSSDSGKSKVRTFKTEAEIKLKKIESESETTKRGSLGKSLDLMKTRQKVETPGSPVLEKKKLKAESRGESPSKKKTRASDSKKSEDKTPDSAKSKPKDEDDLSSDSSTVSKSKATIEEPLHSSDFTSTSLFDLASKASVEDDDDTSSVKSNFSIFDDNPGSSSSSSFSEEINLVSKSTSEDSASGSKVDVPLSEPETTLDSQLGTLSAGNKKDAKTVSVLVDKMEESDPKSKTPLKNTPAPLLYKTPSSKPASSALKISSTMFHVEPTASSKLLVNSPISQLQKSEAKSLKEMKPTDIPVLQKIETVIPKTPIKQETIDPSKIDLIKISPNMPQLEKIDVFSSENINTPVKEFSTLPAIESVKSFKFEDITETPEKMFISTTEQEKTDLKKTSLSSTKSTLYDKKIEFKMKPKSASPSSFDRVRTFARSNLQQNKRIPSPIKKPEIKSKAKETKTTKSSLASKQTAEVKSNKEAVKPKDTKDQKEAQTSVIIQTNTFVKRQIDKLQKTINSQEANKKGQAKVNMEDSKSLSKNDKKGDGSAVEIKKEIKTEDGNKKETGKVPKDMIKVETKISNIFEFDESLELDLEKDSYIVKRKLQMLDTSPLKPAIAIPSTSGANDEFLRNKLQKLNELEKLKQKLSMDEENDHLISRSGSPSRIGDSCKLDKESKPKEDTSTAKQGGAVSPTDTKDSSKQKEDDSNGSEDNEISVKAEESMPGEEEEEDNLLCKETIPGSPAAYHDELIMELPTTSNAMAVMDNTPPTTPGSSLSSPRDGLSPPSDGKGENNGRSQVYTKILPNQSPKSKSAMKRRSSQSERNLKKRIKQSPRNTGAGSDSDELSESYSVMSSPSVDLNNKSKYNSYIVELDPELDQGQRIAVLQQKLQDLRREYMMAKQELVTIDRRRKKILRRERENKKNVSANSSPPSQSTPPAAPTTS